MVEWSANCSNTINGGNCNASCLTTATGPGYTSICREGTWLNATGSCVGELFHAFKVLQHVSGCVKLVSTTR